MKYKRFASYIFLIIIVSITIEKAIPHHHIEYDGLVLPVFSDDSSLSNEDEEEHEEEVHDNIYIRSNNFYCFNTYSSILLFILSVDIHEYSPNISCSPYNIQPKILSTILFIIHSFSSKSPPFS